MARASRWLWVALFVGVFVAGFGWGAGAASLVIAPPTASSSGCDLAVAGITSREAFLDFFGRLKRAAAGGDAGVLSGLVLYPLRVGGHLVIRTPAEFRRDFGRVFTEKVRRVIEGQAVETLFCRDQGVMYGDGEVWVGTNGRMIGIEAINP